jgi:hypothetical protein
MSSKVYVTEWRIIGRNGTQDRILSYRDDAGADFRHVCDTPTTLLNAVSHRVGLSVAGA